MSARSPVCWTYLGSTRARGSSWPACSARGNAVAALDVRPNEGIDDRVAEFFPTRGGVGRPAKTSPLCEPAHTRTFWWVVL